MHIRDVRGSLKRGMEQRRRLLTRGERALAWSLAVAPSLLVLGGVGLLVWDTGAGRGLGIALLIVALLVMAIPISPLLRASVHRREARVARRR